MARDVKIAILGDSRDFARAAKAVQRDADRMNGSFSRVGRGAAQMGKVAAVGFAAVGVGIAAVGASAVKSLMRIEQIGAQTDAVLKSTAGAAGVTRKQIDNLAGSIEGFSGVEAEAITEGQNLLLTFTKIQNKAGKGNKIFDQATEAMVDLSVAMKTDMKSASILVGKALNDPVKGVTALTRAGVQFSEKQKATIKRMVEMNDIAGAQKIILKELNTQFGGSAKALGSTMSGRIERIKHQFGTLTETLAAKLLPAGERILTWASDNMPRAMAAIERAVGNLGPKVALLVAWFNQHLVPAFAQVHAWTQRNWPQIQAVITEAVETVRAVIEGVVSVVTTLWKNFGNNILEFVQRVWPNIQQVIGGALEIIRGIVQTVTSLIKGDWAGVWEGIKKIVSGAWEAVQGIVKTALEVLQTAIGIGLEVVGSIFKAAWRGLGDGLRSAVDAILRQLDRILGPVDDVIARLGVVKSIAGGFKVKDSELPAVLRGKRAHGGSVVAGSPYLVGERGPELFMPGRSGTVIPNNRMGGGSGMVINITMPPGSDGRDVVEQIRRYERSNGTGWRN